MEDQVVTGSDVLDLNDGFNNYVWILEDLDTENLAEYYTAQNRDKKLKLLLIIHKEKYKRGCSLIYNSNITLEEVWS